jgi:hypothetical protein
MHIKLWVHKDSNSQKFCSWEHESYKERNYAFLIYVLSTQYLKMKQHEIPLQYQTYKYVFENKNVDMLPKHWPYDCAINFEEGTWPHSNPFTTYPKMT